MAIEEKQRGASEFLQVASVKRESLLINAINYPHQRTEPKENFMLRVLYLLAAIVLLPRTVSGAGADDFYKGKTIKIVVGFSAGRGFRYLRAHDRASHG